MTSNNQPADDNAKDNSDQLQEHTGSVFGSFTNEDQESDSSIGSGTDDDGMNAEDQPREDEFGDVNTASPGAGFNDQTNDDGSQRGNSGGPIGNLAGKYDTNSSSAGGSGTMRKGKGGKSKKPDHGLVEEGPGPDA